VDVTIPARAFAHWDEGSHSRQSEPGTVHLAVGRSYRELPLQAKLPFPGDAQVGCATSQRGYQGVCGGSERHEVFEC